MLKFNQELIAAAPENAAAISDPFSAFMTGLKQSGMDLSALHSSSFVEELGVIFLRWGRSGASAQNARIAKALGAKVSRTTFCFRLDLEPYSSRYFAALAAYAEEG